MQNRHYIQQLAQFHSDKSDVLNPSILAIFTHLDLSLHKYRTQLHGLNKTIMAKALMAYIEDFIQGNEKLFLSSTLPEPYLKKWIKILTHNLVKVLTSAQYNKALNNHLIEVFNKNTINAHHYIQNNYLTGKSHIDQLSIDTLDLDEYNNAWLKIISLPGQTATLKDDLLVLIQKHGTADFDKSLTIFLIFGIIFLSILQLNLISALDNPKVIGTTMSLALIAHFGYYIKPYLFLGKDFDTYALDPTFLMKKIPELIHQEYFKTFQSAFLPKESIQKAEDNKQAHTEVEIQIERPTPKLKTRPEEKFAAGSVPVQDQKMRQDSNGEDDIIRIGDQMYFKISNKSNTFYHHDTTEKQIAKVLGKSTAPKAAQIIEDTLTEHPIVRPYNSKSRGLKYNVGSLQDITFKFTDSQLGSTRLVIKARLPKSLESESLGKAAEILTPKGIIKK